MSTRPGSIGIPVARVEEQEEFGDSAIAELCDSRLLQGIKSSLAVIDVPQSTERESQDRMIAARFQAPVSMLDARKRFVLRIEEVDGKTVDISER